MIKKMMMENEEMMDVVRQMRSQGWQVEVCDTPVPYFTDGVSAGYPRECGDYDGEMMALPGAMGGCITITVTGDSMVNANIHDGDVVICRFCGRPDEGDVVVARLGDQFVVKAYYKDEHGRQWLLPMNPKYRAIALDDYPECYIVGTVKMKRHSSCTARSCRRGRGGGRSAGVPSRVPWRTRPRPRPCSGGGSGSHRCGHPWKPGE